FEDIRIACHASVRDGIQPRRIDRKMLFLLSARAGETSDQNKPAQPEPTREGKRELWFIHGPTDCTRAEIIQTSNTVRLRSAASSNALDAKETRDALVVVNTEDRLTEQRRYT